MATLLEKYTQRLALSEKLYAEKHEGKKLDNYKKLFVAKCLDNVNKFMNENFTNSVGFQRSQLGQWKQFAMNLTTVALPNLVAPEVVLVQPMSSWTGYCTYLDYVAGSDKGGVRRGDLFNGVYGLGRMTEDRMRYTSDRVVEILPAGQQAMALAWTPVVGSVKVMAMDGSEVDFRLVDAAELKYFFDKRLNPFHADEDGKHQGALAVIDGKEGFDREIELDEYKDPAEDAFGWRGGYGTMAKNADNPEAKKAIILSEVSDLPCKVAYEYENTVIPQDDLPILSAHLNSIQLRARARRIAIYFSQIAAFQAQTDYGFNLGDQLAEQAVGELSYEIDSEIIAGLADAAPMKKGLVFLANDRVGVSLADHYAGFAAVLERAKALIFKATQKFSPNYMICAPDVMTVISFAPGFHAAPAADVAGPYVAGTLNNLKVIVSPIMEDGTFVLGVNGSDLKTSAAVYAPYMPIVPTQLLIFADGGESQGFSTLYDFQILSKLPAGFKEDDLGKEGDEFYRAGRTATEDRPFSPLLVKGMIYYKED